MSNLPDGSRGLDEGVQLSDDPVRRVSLVDELRDYAGAFILIVFFLLALGV